MDDALTYTDLDPEEIFKSLTGWEEIGVEEHFRHAASALAEKAEDGHDPVPLMRALLVVLCKRDGHSWPEAFRYVMGRTIAEVVGCFRDPPADEVEEAPGKPATTSTGSGQDSPRPASSSPPGSTGT